MTFNVIQPNLDSRFNSKQNWIMFRHSPISKFLSTRKISVSTDENIETIHQLFRRYPKLSMLPVEREGMFSGVIYRYDFLQNYLFQQSINMTASDLTTRNIIYLSPENSIADAAEIFETEIFTEIPIVNSYRKLVGVLSKDDLFRLPMNFPNGWQQSIRELQ